MGRVSWSGIDATYSRSPAPPFAIIASSHPLSRRYIIPLSSPHVHPSLNLVAPGVLSSTRSPLALLFSIWMRPSIIVITIKNNNTINIHQINFCLSSTPRHRLADSSSPTQRHRTLRLPICIHCSHPASTLYRRYTASLIVLVRCGNPECGRVVDSYADEEWRRPAAGGRRQREEQEQEASSGGGKAWGSLGISWMDVVSTACPCSRACRRRADYCRVTFSAPAARSSSNPEPTGISSTTSPFFSRRPATRHASPHQILSKTATATTGHHGGRSLSASWRSALSTRT